AGGARAGIAPTRDRRHSGGLLRASGPDWRRRNRQRLPRARDAQCHRRHAHGPRHLSSRRRDDPGGGCAVLRKRRPAKRADIAALRRTIQAVSTRSGDEMIWRASAGIVAFATAIVLPPPTLAAQRPAVWPDSAWRAIGPAKFGGRVDDIEAVADDPPAL